MENAKPSPCCEGQPVRPSANHEKPGYRLWGFVETFIRTPTGSVPRVKPHLDRSDRLGAIACRLGVGRDNYRIAPGLYGIGTPDAQSPVLVTANYKLTFDVLRSHLAGVGAWILVVETYGINVWCAAGKGSFSSHEVAERVKAAGLEKIVSHRRLILPQLSATGVAARRVKKECGFVVVWGPVHARDLTAFLDQGMRCSDSMRTVTFRMRERAALIPVELDNLVKPAMLLFPVLLLVSGIGPYFFSIEVAVQRGWIVTLACLMAVITGAVLTPMFLPWLPGKAFAVKGAVPGAAAAALLTATMAGRISFCEALAMVLVMTSISSYLAMNFTGSTPFTSPTGVEREMRRAIPAQALGSLCAIVLWVGAPFW